MLAISAPFPESAVTIPTSHRHLAALATLCALGIPPFSANTLTFHASIGGTIRGFINRGRA